MIEKSKINSFQLGILVFYLSKACFLGIGFTEMEQLTHQDTWISVILGMIIGFIPLFIILYISNRQGDLNIIQLNYKLFGKFVGAIINLLIIILILTYGVSALTNLTKFIQINYLMRTPNLVISATFLLVTVIAAIKGIEVVTRAAVVLFILVILSFFPIIIALFPYIELENLKPMMEYGYIPILKSSLLHTSYMVAPLFALLIIPKKQVDDEKNYNRSIVIWYIIVNITLFIIFFWTLSILGHKLAALYNYPTYSVLKKITIMTFIERVENNAILHWLFDYFFAITIVLFFVKQAILSSFRIKKPIWNQIIVILTTIFILIFPSYVFEKYIDLQMNFFKYFGQIMGIGALSITLIIFIRLLFEKKQTMNTG